MNRCPYPWLFACLLACAPSLSAASNEVWLSDLDLSVTRQSYGKPRADLSSGGRPMKIAGTVYARGLGTHADSQLHLDLKGEALRFTAMPGIDDEVAGYKASLRFSIVGDGRVLWRGPMLIPGRVSRAIDVDVAGVRFLSLLVDVADGIQHYDHADWADAKFHLRGTVRPETLAETPSVNTAEVRKTFEAGRRAPP